MVFAELVQFCQDRGLSIQGSKADLIDGLLHWKEDTRPVPAPSIPQLFDDDLPVSPLTAEQQRLELNSREFSALFLDGNPGLGIPYHELQIGHRLGSGGFKDCFAGMYKGEPVAIGELRLAQFSEVDLQEIKHEIQVLK
ncbi:hypothetical protein BJV82DRAFT_505308 [Fennellomyces sp. T-0311]|nr:hypothetical protein BJV82DRAFT_505308 [Fennellomyces sp. T-0311]